MPKYLVLYRGDVTPTAAMPAEEHDEVMDRWGEWMERHGSGLEDPGFPFGDRAAIDGDGRERVPTNLTGYSIVRADTLDAARELCLHHPFLHDTGTEHTVEIFELVPV